jgi:hypothetical protein
MLFVEKRGAFAEKSCRERRFSLPLQHKNNKNRKKINSNEEDESILDRSDRMVRDRSMQYRRQLV